MMRSTKMIFLSLLVRCAVAQQISSQPPARGKRIVIAVSAALDGDPLKDITAVRRVVFVMKGGNVYKHAARGATS